MQSIHNVPHESTGLSSNATSRFNVRNVRLDDELLLLAELLLKEDSFSTFEQRHSNFDFDELLRLNLRTDRHEI